MTPADYYLIIPASGIGSRMNSSLPKQYIVLDNGLTVIEQTLTTLLNIDKINGCVVAISNNDTEFKRSKLYNHPKILSTSIGGKERINSVISAINKLDGIAKKDDWILVHDAVRPCIQKDEIMALIDELSDSNTGGLLGIKITDTIKQINSDSNIEKTIDRSNLWKACTPQMYRFGVLSEALDRALKDGINATDEARAIEHLNLHSKIVPCSNSNIKITTTEDLNLANHYINSQEN